MVEARPRLGGRAWTITDPSGFPIDLGCGWLHSADRNPWMAVAEAQRKTVDKTPPPWRRLSLPTGFPVGGQKDFLKSQEEFFARVSERAQREPDIAAGELLTPGGRWNSLINAIATYISGAELDRLSIRDFDNFEDTGVNWRIVEGYGATIAACGDSLPVRLNCPVQRIDHSGKRLRIETPDGTIEAEKVIITLPTTVLAEAEGFLTRRRPRKICRSALMTSFFSRLRTPRNSKRTAACLAPPIERPRRLIICGHSAVRSSRLTWGGGAQPISRRVARTRFLILPSRSWSTCSAANLRNE